MFDILTEPWLYVLDGNGNIQHIGLYEALINAHKYKRICENKNIALIRRLQQRLLEAFVVDIFNIDDIKTAKKILEQGYFDKEKIDDYFDMCENSGISFDVFDEERPFLQTDKATYSRLIEDGGGLNSSKNKGRIAAVSSINPKAGSGLNKVFFTHFSVDDYLQAGAKDSRLSFYDDIYTSKTKPENAHSEYFEDYFNLLLLKQCASGMGGGGYKPSLPCMNSLIPIFYHIDILGDNENLFTSIIFNIGIQDNAKLGIPMWRWDSYDYGMNLVNEGHVNLPYLTGLFFPTAYIYPDFSSINTNHKTISRIYKAGVPSDTNLLKEARAQWSLNTEPSVAVIDNKKIANYDYSNEKWMDIRYFSKTGKGKPKSLSCIDKMFEDDFDEEDDFDDFIEITAYYIKLNQAEYYSQGSYQCNIPNLIIYDVNISDIVNEFMGSVIYNKIGLLDNIVKIQKALYDIKELKPDINKKKYAIKTVETDFENQFLRYCEGLFKYNFINEILKTNQDKTIDKEEKINRFNEILLKYKKLIVKKKYDLLNSIPVPYGKTLLFKEMLLKNTKEGEES